MLTSFTGRDAREYLAGMLTSFTRRNAREPLKSPGGLRSGPSINRNAHTSFIASGVQESLRRIIIHGGGGHMNRRAECARNLLQLGSRRSFVSGVGSTRSVAIDNSLIDVLCPK